MDRTGWAQLLLCTGICLVSLLVGTAAWLFEGTPPQMMVTADYEPTELIQNLGGIATLQVEQKKTGIYR